MAGRLNLFTAAMLGAALLAGMFVNVWLAALLAAGAFVLRGA